MKATATTAAIAVNTLAGYLKRRGDNTETIPKGSFIEVQPERLYIVVSGTLLVKEGADQVANVRRPEETFGHGSLGTNVSTAIGQATALEDSEVVSYLASEVKDMARRSGNLAVAVIEALATEVGDSQNTDGEIAQRLARVILKLGVRFGKTKGEMIIIEEKWLTQEVLSFMARTSREIVTSKMNALKRAYITDHRRGHIQIINKEDLRRIASGEEKL